MPTFYAYGLVVNVIVDGKDNMDEKTREVAYIRMYNFGWNFRQLGCHMLWWSGSTSKIFILSTRLISSSTCVLVVKVIDIVVGKDNLVEETSEVGDILM